MNKISDMDSELLLRAALKHIEWIDKENAGPNYGGLTRDTHPVLPACRTPWEYGICGLVATLGLGAFAICMGEE